MQQTVVRVICAIGQSGQIGLNGVLPWEGNRGSEYVADVARFFDITRGHVLLAGPRTIASVPEFARSDRTLGVLRSSMDPEQTLREYAGRVVFIGGGPPVWDDGPADRWFNPKWLTAGSIQDGARVNVR